MSSSDGYGRGSWTRKNELVLILTPIVFFYLVDADSVPKLPDFLRADSTELRTVPKLPDFIRADSSELECSPNGFSPVRPINFGTPPGTPVKASPFHLFGSLHPGSTSPSGSEDNPFIGSSKPKARFELDYLSESQWYSDYPHHLTEEYLEELFRLDRRGMSGVHIALII